MLAFSLMVAIPTYAQEAVWDSSMPFNFQTYFNLNVDPAQVDWYITDQTSGQEYQVPENEETAYIFNREGRDEWGKVTIRPEFTCPNSGDVKPFSPTTVSLEVLDYGLYFIGDFAQTEKFFTGDIDTDGNAYFDPSRPTVIYLHGRNHGSTQIHKREQLLDEVGAETLARKWRAQGWNVGIFYWSQISDDHPLNIEVKIHNGQIGGLTWRKEDDAVVWGDVNQFLLTNDAAAPDKSVSQLFLEAYDEFMTEYGLTGEDVRLTGHSLGGHLAVTAMPLIPPSQRPTRLALLDPWFSDTYDEDFDTDLTFLIDNGTLVEWYQTTWFNDMTQFMGSIKSIYDGIGAYTEEEYDQAISDIYDGINNLATYEAMLRKVAYLRLAIGYSDYVSVGPLEVASPTSLHNMAIVHYFNSIEDGVLPEMVETAPFVSDPAETVTGDYGIPYVKARIKGFNAAACDEIISRMMGHRYWQAGGGNTKTTEDDLYGFENGYAPAQLKPAQAMGTLEESTACLEGGVCYTLLDGKEAKISNKQGIEVYAIVNGSRKPLLNQQGENSWNTDSEGSMCIPQELINPEIDFLSGDETLKLFFRYKIDELPVTESKANPWYTNQSAIYIDNLSFVQTGANNSYDEFAYTELNTTTVILGHTEILYNLIISVEWNADNLYLAEVERMADVLSGKIYDYTDGQARLDTVIITDNGNSWEVADIQINARSNIRPSVDPTTHVMTMPRKLFGNNYNEARQRDKSFTSTYPPLLSQGNARVVSHESGHLLFGLEDEYLYVDAAGEQVQFLPAPGLFGLMENPSLLNPAAGGAPGTEISSSLVYQSADPKYTSSTPTAQWYHAGMGAWEHLEQLYEGNYQGNSIWVEIDRPQEKLSRGISLTDNIYFNGPSSTQSQLNTMVFNREGNSNLQKLITMLIDNTDTLRAVNAGLILAKYSNEETGRRIHQGHSSNTEAGIWVFGIDPGDTLYAYAESESGLYIGKSVYSAVSTGFDTLFLQPLLAIEMFDSEDDADDYFTADHGVLDGRYRLHPWVWSEGPLRDWFLTEIVKNPNPVGPFAMSMTASDLLFSKGVNDLGLLANPSPQLQLSLQDQSWNRFYLALANPQNASFDQAGVQEGNLSVEYTDSEGGSRHIAEEDVQATQDAVLYLIVDSNERRMSKYPGALENAPKGIVIPNGWGQNRCSVNQIQFVDRPLQKTAFSMWGWTIELALDITRSPVSPAYLLKRIVPASEFMKIHGSVLQVAVIIGDIDNCDVRELNENDLN